MERGNIMSKLESLIEKGNSFTFKNNCYQADTGVYSRASQEFYVWLMTVEDFILKNYGEDSAPSKLYEEVDRSYFDGYTREKFDENFTKVKAALQSCLHIEPKTTLTSPSDIDFLDIIFEKFHKLTNQLKQRYDKRATLEIKDEYDVQDFLLCLLKLHFDDIRKEEYTPSYAGSSARMDFLLKDEKIVIEVKMTRNGLTDKEIGNQLIEDIARYKSHPDCKKLICFVYDPESRINNPNGIKNDLKQNSDDLKVEVVIMPQY
ncbi:MAG: hypothetical protein RBS89_08190 [Candidatus Delongbacteria bacterium]|jgi:hypothetical protein|nr:hypothetical protein [Candidatus Delongbacteria bacterium]